MGLSDLGTNGSVGYIYDTSSFRGSITFETPFSTYSPGYAAFVEAPDWASIQLDTVAVNVSYPGSSSGLFWIQNVVHFNGSTLEFEDNVWNFTSHQGLNPGTLLAPKGTLVTNVPVSYYYRNGPSFAVTYPFSLVMYNTIAIVNGHPTAFLNYSITSGSGTVNGNYDVVTFNGKAVSPPQFQVNGESLDDAGMLNDAELIFGGDGGGANVDILGLNATATLEYRTSMGGYVSVPSAYDFGADSGETSLGIAATYVGSTVHLGTGPSMLFGLWNTTSGPIALSAKPGAIRVQLTVEPSYAFVFANLTASSGPRLSEADLSYVPTNATGVVTLELPPPPASASYGFFAWADGYANASIPPVGGNATGLLLDLPASPHTLDAPVYFASDAEVVAYGTAGVPGTTYSSTARTLWMNATNVALAPPFLELNDYEYPTFVLFAAEGLNLSVHVNGFQQSPGAVSYSLDDGGPTSLARWSQGYYFFGGSGAFSVSNTTLPGSTVAYYAYDMDPVAAVEFYDTSRAEASNIRSSQDSFGVAFVNSSAATVRNVTGETGANGFDSIYSRGVDASDVSSNGTDSYGAPAYASYLINSSATTIVGLAATNGSIAIEAANASFSASSVTVFNATGISAANSSYSNLTGTVVSGVPAGFGGIWFDSTDIAIHGLSVVGNGLDLVNDTFVTATGVSASGLGSTGIFGFTGSSFGTFDSLSADDAAVAANLSFSENDSLQWVNASDGSVGAYLFEVNNTTAADLEASDFSVGLLWQVGSNGTVTRASATSGSLPVEVDNVTNLSVSFVGATNDTLGAPYFLDPAMGFELPTAALALENDSNVSVTNVSATFYPAALTANLTNGLQIENLTAWSGGSAVSLGMTNGTIIVRLFSFGDQAGVWDNNSTNLSVSASTLEDSVGFGLVAINGTNVTVLGDNFVGNDGASTDGRFVAVHDQVSVSGTVNVSFSSNFWSDHSGSGGYPIEKGLSDRSPQSSFLSSFLAFSQTGLAAGDRWVVGFRSAVYASDNPIVYLPAWSIPTGTYGFLVIPPTGYDATPSAGSVSFSGINDTVPIQFTGATGSPAPSGTSFPWIFVGAGVGALVVVVALVVLLRRRNQTRPPGTIRRVGSRGRRPGSRERMLLRRNQ
jgi:hypothetical protein